MGSIIFFGEKFVFLVNFIFLKVFIFLYFIILVFEKVFLNGIKIGVNIL